MRTLVWAHSYHFPLHVGVEDLQQDDTSHGAQIGDFKVHVAGPHLVFAPTMNVAPFLLSRAECILIDSRTR